MGKIPMTTQNSSVKDKVEKIMRTIQRDCADLDAMQKGSHSINEDNVVDVLVGTRLTAQIVVVVGPEPCHAGITGLELGCLEVAMLVDGIVETSVAVQLTITQ